MVGDDRIKLVLLEREEGEWTEETKRRSKHLLDRLLAYANNVVIMSQVREGYVFGEAEIPGLKAFVGEGGFRGAETLLLPLPQPVTRITLYKKGETDTAVKVHEYMPPGEMWGYETKIEVDPALEYDLIVVETPEGPRPLFRHELKIPTRKTQAKKKKKKRRRKTRRKNRKTTTHVKTAKKKTSKKKTRTRRKRRKRKTSKKK